MKNHLLPGPGWEGNLGSWFWHWCILGPQPWDTLQLGQEGVCEGSVVAAAAPPETWSWRDTRVGGDSSVPTAWWSPPILPTLPPPTRVAWLGLLWCSSACLEVMPRLEMGIGGACRGWDTLPWLTP